MIHSVYMQLALKGIDWADNCLLPEIVPNFWNISCLRDYWKWFQVFK